MIIKVKLRCIGNSMGVILPADVITGLKKGDVITLDVTTKDAEVITKDKKMVTPVIPPLTTEDFEAIGYEVKDGIAVRPAATLKKTLMHDEPSVEFLADVPSVQTVPASPSRTKPALAPDGHPIQHDNTMMVGYVPKEVAV